MRSADAFDALDAANIGDPPFPVELDRKAIRPEVEGRALALREDAHNPCIAAPLQLLHQGVGDNLSERRLNRGSVAWRIGRRLLGL